MSQTVTDLRGRRGVPKRQLTILEKWETQSAGSATIGEVKCRLEYLEKLANEFDDIQTQLEKLDPTEWESSEREDVESRILTIKSKLLNIQHSHELSSSMNENAEGNNRTIIIDNSGPAELSAFELKVFDGDYIEYPSFIDSFKTLIHNNNSRHYNDVKKFAILKKYLGPNVMQAMQHYRMTAENYHEFLAALDRRYGKKQLVFDKFISDLFKLNKAQDTRGLRNLVDGTSGILKSLELMATSDEIKYGLLIFLTLEKCDSQTVGKWEERIAQATELPTWDEFVTFLETRCTVLECTEYSTSVVHSAPKPMTSTPFNARNQQLPPVISPSRKCKICGGGCTHISTCNTFTKLDTHQRYDRVKAAKACIRCLNETTHNNCRAVCAICAKYHHSLLHHDTEPLTFSNANAAYAPTTTLLATVQVQIKGKDGRMYTYRALLDSGSQVNFVSTRVCQQMGFQQRKTNITVTGVHGSIKTYQKAAEVHLKSCITDHEVKMVAVINNKLGGCYPSAYIATSDWPIPDTCKLADPEFNEPRRIDFILNADIFYQSLSVGQVHLGDGKPVLQKTLFGWIVAGDVKIATPTPPILKPQTLSFSASTRIVDEMEWLKKFFELEELKTYQSWSKEEQDCERHFLETVKRNAEGRFIVRLPFKHDPTLLGTSIRVAMSRLIGMETKLNRFPPLRAAYHQFMEEYIALGHMEQLSSNENTNEVNLLSHFYVLNDNSTTTPLRVVFDGACKTETGYSLNDLLMVGPVLQPDLFTHLIRFRSYRIAIIADMSKMYRQILLDEPDRRYQCILWRGDEQSVSTYKLNTVTYGTAPASYIAQRCLQYLADTSDGPDNAAAVLKEHFYMDDMLSGADNINDGIDLINNVTKLLASGGFPLKKIMSNDAQLLSNFDAANIGETKKIGDRNIVSTLGLKWVPNEDVFEFHFVPGQGKITKRLLLSEVGRIFDPLGLLQPVIVVAKILVQYLWSIGLDWDETVPQHVESQWEKFRSELHLLADIKIPRYVIIEEAKVREFHVFADASEKAYAAAVYLKSVDKNEQIAVQLLCAKSKVAPLKTISLARLELCSALLGSELLEMVQKTNAYNIDRIFCWTDSTTALKWIKSSPHLWKTFVATRVTVIQNLTKAAEWNHVPGNLNPADIASRGSQPEKLMNFEPWFSGPKFLWETEVNWPVKPVLPKLEEMPEMRPIQFTFTAKIVQDEVETCKFQDWNKLNRTFGYMAKFVNKKFSLSNASEQRLTARDIEAGTTMMIRLVQKVQFATELKLLKEKKDIPKTSTMHTLNPFLDDQGIIRVGGRLENATHLPFDARHPIILPKSHKLTKSLIFWYHTQFHHVGPSTLLAQIRMRYWPIQALAEVKSAVFNCIRCRKIKPILYKQIMGNLPRERVQIIERCFMVTGIDYLGPIKVHYRGRGRQPTDAYIAVFICFSTKAIHLEVVESLTTDSFICALRRFVARYGAPNIIWSDNARNFVGANNELQQLNELLASSKHWDAIHDWSRDNKGIQWKFIPPRSPHWGGLWEAAVKSTKHHLKRTIANAKLSLTELWTLTADIVAILNDRPLIPVATRPDDPNQYLTASELIYGYRITSLPEPILPDTSENYQKRWKVLAALRQNFWRTWSTDYLQTLQQRYKWLMKEENAKVGDIVLMVEENVPSIQWAMGKIIEVYKGDDDFVRAVKIKTQYGEYERAITKVCKLPVEPTLALQGEDLVRKSANKNINKS